MQEEPTEWFSIKYLWTAGIQSWWGTVGPSGKYAGTVGGRLDGHRHERIGTECFRSKAEAVQAANDAKVRKIRSLEKKLEDVRATTFAL